MPDILFPDFRYYKLDRDQVRIQDGHLVSIHASLPAQRRANTDILQAVVTLLRYEPDEQAPDRSRQRWTNAMIWSWYNWLPDYFFQAPASGTHKYHPRWADRPDGLLLHSLAVCRVAASLCDLIDINPENYNALIFAGMHHDMFKYGDLDQYEDGAMTVHEHPVLGGDFFRLPEVRRQMADMKISGSECDDIAGLISCHAGPYRTSKYSEIKLPECAGRDQKLLYKADYFASRKEDHWVKDLMAIIP